MTRATGLLLGAVLCLPTDSTAQTLVGRVLEEGRNTPVAGATISIVDLDGEHRAQTMSDSLGAFRLDPPEAGEYLIEAAALGYAPTRSPLFAMTVEGSVPFDLMLRPNPIGLVGLEVSVEPIEVVAEQFLQNFGQTPASLRNRWINRAEIDQMTTPGLPKDIIRRQNIAGVTVDEADPGSSRGATLCVRFSRRVRKCALTILDGVLISPKAAFHIDTRHIEAIAILEPLDAATFYGTQGGGGAVLIWTRQGRR